MAFINTRHCPDEDDALADARGRVWLAGITGSEPDEREAISALRDLRTLREGIRQLAAVNNGQRPDGRIVAAAQEILATVPLHLQLGDERRTPGLQAAGTDLAGHCVAAIAQDYLALRASGNWLRLKACLKRRLPLGLPRHLTQPLPPLVRYDAVRQSREESELARTRPHRLSGLLTRCFSG